jgi:hypothetical protein
MILCFFIVIFSQSYKTAQTESPRYNMGAVLSDSSASAFDYLKTTMDAFHNTFDVYTDIGAAGNHFGALGMMPDDNAAVNMDQCCTGNPLSGSTCIQCTFQSQGDNYGGYYFLNGTLTGSETEPQANWGDVPNAGFDLSGAASITFYARGETGVEKVEFFVGGVGWGVNYQGDSTFPEKPYPDSFPKVRTGNITLSSQWQQYSIDLQGYDLSYVLSGFGWAANSVDNNYQNITFYMDHIQWNKPRPEELRFLVSYETNPTQEDFDVTNRNAAFSYDNALVLLAFLASGSEDDLNRAVILADSFVHAIHYDRFYDGVWLRNAYTAGDLVQFPGWTPNGRQDTARMPGFWNCDNDSWNEDSFQVSIHTGNVGWVIIGLLSSYQVLGNTDYLQAAQELAEWVETDLKDYRGSGGYTGGYEGWEPNPDLLLYKSTEHNLDLYVAFQRLYEITSDETWLQRATHAKNFVQAMWDDIEGKFYTGTDDDGITINQDVIPLDPQTWSILAFRDEQDLYLRGLEYAEVHHRVDDGFDFDTDGDGIWYEGTAQMAVTYKVVGAIESAAALMTAIENIQFQNGAIPAASKDGLTTGFYMPDGSPWLYFHRAHIGASAWYLFAKLGVNPYWICEETSVPTLTVTSPNGGENWEANSQQILYWTSTGTVGNVKIEYSTNNGTNWTEITASTGNDGIHPWTVPDAVSSQCLIRVSETSGSPSDISDSVFSIVPIPTITITSPNGGESWMVGSLHNITWTTTGTVGNVKIEYSVNNGENWSEIIASTENDGSFPWTVPGTVSDLCLIRVSETDGSPSDTSDGVFSILPIRTITVTSPNGGENWDVGSVYDITWTSEGNVENVRIEYSTNGGNNWAIITPSTENDGSYNWNVSATPSDNCLVRISDTDEDGGTSDVSDEVFSIVSTVSGSITLRSPNGGETWVAGLPQEIKWNSTGDINNVTIQYSTDNGTTWKTIAKNDVNNHIYNWVVPDTVSDQCLVRVTSNDSDLDPKPSDVSDAVFSIVLPPEPTVKVTAPNGGEQLVVGSRFTISWYAANTREDVQIEYSINGGETWTDITGAAENNGKYDWTVPGTPSDNCLVRISITGGQPSDVSDGVFSIVSPSPSDITVTSPNGGETWTVGASQEIKWTSTGGIDSVFIDYSKDNGTTWKTIVQTTPNSGSFNWTIPDTVSDECLVRVTANDSDLDPKPSDVSDRVFSIVPPASPVIRVISPNGGEQLVVGSRFNITWYGTDTREDVKIEYSINGGDTWPVITEATENDGEYDWIIPGTPSGNCLVRISETDGQPVDVSDAIFSIVPPLSDDITVTAPNGGESWTVGSLQEITWTSTGDINNVLIEYSTDNGFTWKMIIRTTPNNGSFDWTIPVTDTVTVSDECLVRVTANDDDLDPKPSDVSDEVFSIVSSLPGEFRLASPNGDEEWEVGSTRSITWTSSGDISSVMIEYSPDNGNTWSTIVSSTENSGTYDWLVPGTVSDECLVRVSANDGGGDPTPSDVSDALFSIILPSSPNITVIAPNGGEQLIVNSIFSINWFSTNSREDVKIEYSTNGGDSWTAITDSTENDGEYDWTVPGEPSEICLVRISETDGEPVDVSDAVFSIVSPLPGDLTVLTPNGGENLETGSEYNISWTCSGLNNVIIEYSVNNGATWLTIDKVPADNGSYTWTVPGTPSEMCLVRITGADSDENPSDVSDEVFTIFDPSQAFVEVITPNGGESLGVGEEYYITWTSTGVNTVLIEYSTDNGDQWIPIDTVSAIGGRYTWTVPNTPSDSCLIRISGGNPGEPPFDASDAVFSIQII